MDNKPLRNIFEIGETIAVEFKRCGNKIENDVYETVCSFLNRFGGDLFLGVLDDGTVSGVPEKAAPDLVKNFISSISNPLITGVFPETDRRAVKIECEYSKVLYKEIAGTGKN